MLKIYLKSNFITELRFLFVEKFYFQSTVVLTVLLIFSEDILHYQKIENNITSKDYHFPMVIFSVYTLNLNLKGF